MWQNWLTKPKSRRVAVILALIGTVTPIAGLHKFYLGQPLWGFIYFLLWFTPMPRVASAFEAVWYLAQDSEQFNQRFSTQAFPSTAAPAAAAIDPDRVSAIADALRQLDQLRADGLMSEYEFEQKRRQLIDRIA